MKQKQSRHSFVLKLCGVLLVGLFFFYGLRFFYPLRAQNSDKNLQKFWIYLDEGLLKREDFVRLDFPQKTLTRLAKRGACDDFFSNAVPGKRISAEIEKYVDRIVCYSRSLKAYSAFIEPSEIAGIQNLPFVKNVAPVKFYRRPTRIESTVQQKKSTDDIDFYGNSYDQLQQLNIPAAHDSGYTGAGVRIAIIDAGFFKDHEAFKHIIESGRLIAERDFIYGDNDVQYDMDGDDKISIQARHGTSVWSLVGAYVPNMMIGAAYGAEFLLAKTEIITSESLVEEDLMVAAIEWADKYGADIISSSVTYRYFDDASEDYTFEELDGRTTNSAKAVNWAFERGIVSVICAGNENNRFADGGLMTPSDAIGALTVGAVNRDGVIAGFSSHGPTPDGRIKPEVCGLGIDAFIANYYSGTSYGYGDGTSYSTPLIAGSVALLMEKYPTLSSLQIIELIKEHANRQNAPSNFYGWGIPDVCRALFESDSTMIVGYRPKQNRIYAIPNPARSYVRFFFRWTNIVPNEAAATLTVYNIAGQRIWTYKLSPKMAGTDEFVDWNLKNISGEFVSSGVYIVAVRDGHTTIRGKCLVL